MSVRQSLLAILDQGPCYGYQLRAEFDRRTGSARALNVGQIYSTLERLERDDLVSKGDTDAHGHVYYAITDAGSAEVASWLRAPVDRGQSSRDELSIKIALAATLPGVDISAVIASERAALLAQLGRLRGAAGSAGAVGSGASARPDPDGPEALARALVVDAMIFGAEAELRWLDHTEERLAQHPEHAMALELSTERPKRGRPAAG